MIKWILWAAVIVGGWFLWKACGRMAQEAGKSVEKTMEAPSLAQEKVDRANRVILETAIRNYQMSRGQNPPSLSSLVSEGFLDRIPPGDWRYDASAGRLE